MIFQPIPTGFKNNVAYLLGDKSSREAAVVDMGYKPDLVLGRVQSLGYDLKYMLATHRHRDHIGSPAGIAKVKDTTGARLAAFKDVDVLKAGDVRLDDGDDFTIGTIRVQVIHAPGHTADSVCFLVDGRKLLTGDSLFVGRIPKGDCMREFYESLHDRLMALPDDIEVWPGHDLGDQPSSTIGQEKRTNHVLQMDYRDFCRRRWNGQRWIT